MYVKFANDSEAHFAEAKIGQTVGELKDEIKKKKEPELLQRLCR